jgi:hypothetical protein
MEEKYIKIGFEVLAEIPVDAVEGDSYMQKLEKFKSFIEEELKETVSKWNSNITSDIKSTEEAIINEYERK